MEQVILEHWRASEAGDSVLEHAIYATDAVLDYPQSGERFRGRETIAAQRGGHPADRHFTVLSVRGEGSLWVSECVITYDGSPTYSVSIMQFDGDSVVHETQYFADPFGAPSGAWRSRSPCRGGTSAGSEQRPAPASPGSASSASATRPRGGGRPPQACPGAAR